MATPYLQRESAVITNEHVRGIAIVSSVFYPSIGGAQRVALDTGRLLRDRGVDAFVVTRHYRGLARYEEVSGVPTYRVGNGDAGKALAAISFILGALWLLWRSRARYDVIHCHQMISPMTIGLLARALTRRPLVVMPHRSGPIGDIGVLTLRRPLSGRLRLLAVRRWGDAFVCISPAIAAELRGVGVPEARLWPITNGVDTERLSPLDADGRARRRRELGLPPGPLAVFSGRLVTEKGLDGLLSAWPMVIAALPDARLLLVGEGDQRGALESQARQQGVADQVHFHGASDDVGPILQAADLFVLPSHAEGLPVALLEALACGLPAVATDVDGTRDVIADGETGRLVPLGDPMALAAGIVEGFTAPAATAWARRGRAAVVQHYGLDDVIEQYLKLYRALIDAQAPGRARRADRGPAPELGHGQEH
jgi:glycosyltransferase involved in cell wall biosynthesis